MAEDRRRQATTLEEQAGLPQSDDVVHGQWGESIDRDAVDECPVGAAEILDEKVLLTRDGEPRMLRRDGVSRRHDLVFPFVSDDVTSAAEQAARERLPFVADDSFEGEVRKNHEFRR